MNNDQILKDLGAYLETARLARNLKQQELADRAGTSRQTIGKIESGQSVQSRFLINTIWALGLEKNLLDALAPQNDILARSVAFGTLPKRIKSRVADLSVDERGEFD